MTTLTRSRITPQAPPAMTFFRPPGRRHFDDDAPEIYAMLLPHLRRATCLRSAMMTSSVADGTVSLAVLDQMRHAALLLVGYGQVIQFDTVARRLLERQKASCMRRDGQFGTSYRAQATSLAVLIGRCLARQSLSGDLLLRRDEEAPLPLTATPLPSHAADPTRTGTVKPVIKTTS